METEAIRELDAAELEARLEAFADILHACVHDGASVGFVLPYGRDEARAFWQAKVLPGVAAGEIALLAALEAGRVVGTVQIDHAMMPNQRHRVDAKKLLVHPDHRRRGHGRALMEALERRVRAMGRGLICLDTRTGDAAEPLYLSLGYEIAGRIPDFCRDTLTDRLDPTTLMYKRL